MLESTGAGLLRSVLETPDDDAPWLIFADWLDDRGLSDRAWVIRKIFKAPTYTFTWHRHAGPRSNHAERYGLIRGIRPRLTALTADAWPTIPHVQTATYRRGFVESVSLPAWAFAITAPALFLTHPVTHVEFPDRGTIPQMEERSRGAVVAHAMALPYHWPAELFPDKPIGEVLWFPSFADAKAGLSRAAVGYGRRSVGLPMVGEGSPVGATSEGYCNPGATGVGGSG